MQLAAGHKGMLQVPFFQPDELLPGAEYALNLSFVLQADCAWAKSGHEVYWEQFGVPFSVPEKPVARRDEMGELAIVENNERLAVEGHDFLLLFSKAEGRIITYHAAGRDLLASGPLEQYYRAPTDHDLLMGNPPAISHQWRAAGIDRLQRTVLGFEWAQLAAQEVVVRIHSRIQAEGQPAGIDSQVIYAIFGDGQVLVDSQVVVPDGLPQIPRIGLELSLPAGFERLVWFGRGPHENYCDRKLGAALGVYTSSVDEQFTPYVFTSESGGKEDVRWLALLDEEGCGLQVIGSDRLHFDALHYSVQDLEQAGHPFELTRLAETILHLDGWHMGVGGDDGWMAPVHPEFMINPGRYQYAFRLKPVRAGDDLSASARTRLEGVL